MTKITINNNSEPETPATGRTTIYADSTTKTLKSKDDTGLVLAYGDNKKSLVSATDTTENFLLGKIIGGTGVAVTQTGTGGDETLVLSVDGPTTIIGGYNASTNTPDLDASPISVIKGGTYHVTVTGVFFTINVEVGDALIALVDNPTLETDWLVLQTNLDAASIKTLYESNADTNAFTDAEKTKLASAGDVLGPAVAVDNAIARFDGVTGKAIQDYTSDAPTISDTGDMVMSGDFTATNAFKYSYDNKHVNVGYDYTQPLTVLNINSGAGHSELLHGLHNSANRFIITTSGMFSLYPAATTQGIRLFRTGSTSEGLIILTDGSYNTTIDNNAYDIIHQTNGVERFRVKFSGATTFSNQLQLAVGTTTLAPLNIQPATDLKTTPVEGDIEYHDGNLFATVSGSVRKAVDLTTGVKNTTTTVVNTVTETTVYSYTLAANELNIDQRIIFAMDGVFSSASNSDNFTIRFKLGGVTIHSIIRTGNSATNEGWEAEYKGTIRSVGVSGTFVDHARYMDQSGIYASADVTPHSIDTTGSGVFSVTMQWVNAKAGNTFSCSQGHLTFKH